MSELITYQCELKEGIHARPAGHIERLCNTFQSEVVWKNTRTGLQGNAKSALSIVATDTLFNDECQITISGDDEFDASLQFGELLGKLASFETTHNDEACAAPDGYLPRSLRELRADYVQGTRISGGVAIARPLLIQSLSLADLSVRNPGFIDTPAQEKARLLDGLESLKREKEASLANSSGVEHDIIQAHLSIITDIAFQGNIAQYLSENTNVWAAIVRAATDFCDILNQSSSKYIKERTLDVLDITVQLLGHIYGEDVLPRSSLELHEPVIILANNLTPGKFLGINKAYLAGMVLTATGKMSHTAILARSLGIPTLTDIDFSALDLPSREAIVIDGDLGMMIARPDENMLRYYRHEIVIRQTMQQEILADISTPAATSDGHEIAIAANIASLTEAEAAFSNGAEGVGLFRTEMSFMDRETPPTLEELTALYTRVVRLADGKPVIFRTFDIGGDKPVDYLSIVVEANPFLGYRAVRTYPRYLDLFKMQLRAILSASAAGDARIMIPMIASVDEVIWCREVLQTVQQEMSAARLPYRENIEMGVMLEVPSVMFAVPEIAEHADFFSVGSNDLTQYFFAADRGNTQVESVYDNYSPAFLRAMKFVADQMHRAGKWIGICGELAATNDFLPLFIGMGFDELSMSNAAVPVVKHALRDMDYEKCQALVTNVVAAKSTAQVKALLDHPDVKAKTSKPILGREFIIDNLDAANRNEVIKKLTDNLWLRHRTDNREKLCDDLWAREDTFPTAVGFGFAIPHTKSDHILHSTISVAKLISPVIWGEQQVDTVFMLTISKSAGNNEHMKYFSTLARKLMNEEFRNEIKNSVTSEALYNRIVRTLEV
ncbi:fructose-specific PTS system IIA-like component|uniref:Uncharacterized protein n=1 Tax=Brenneria salicis ATCC 15712 = DSM 30166 TaxID=714314 RepID=A0A366I3S8_9GAMM|nr:phosphoenolpyruvate--protein phosphotransferase [Brenneria salicis]NMN92066.1 fructose-specific PTS system IIA-like component [Brenneria salicis ATCC 15712 = DSM 30166]RBP61185.1 phosphocarrier protein HPr /phosphoenolpyruvate--protein phosphotransferase /PTS system unknown substrate IIA component (Fru family) [Brenneria salicis ATCC 15712 = DSM 30166]RLM30205.1 phosphoenolpyruvate--protein phosphotransferase [Brenneria salicis ATCC 15712 = DSM 30166]